MTIVAGGDRAAKSVRQPMQQLSTQVLLLPWSFAGAAGWAASLWHKIAPGAAVASAAARAAPKPAITLDSAIA